MHVNNYILKDMHKAFSTKDQHLTYHSLSAYRINKFPAVSVGTRGFSHSKLWPTFTVLAAEIFQHFLPKLVDMHNYSKADSLKQKEQNWLLLNR